MGEDFTKRKSDRSSPSINRAVLRRRGRNNLDVFDLDHGLDGGQAPGESSGPPRNSEAGGGGERTIAGLFTGRRLERELLEVPASMKRLAIVLVFLGCGGSEPAGPDPDGGLAPDGGGGAPGGGPITERPSRDSYRCQVERDRTDHTPRTWRNTPPALVKTTGGAAFLVRMEANAPMPILAPPGDLLVSTFDAAGTFGAPVTVPIARPEGLGGFAAAPRGDGFAAVWVEGGSIRFAAFDASGQLTPSGVKEVATAVDQLGNPSLAAGPDGGFGLVYAPEPSVGSREVRLVVLDGDGKVRMAPRLLTAQPGTAYAHPAPSIVASSTGYAMIWRDPAAPGGGIDFAAASATGAETIARHRISADSAPGIIVGGSSGFDAPTTALVAAAGGFVAGWVEVRQGVSNGTSGAASMVRLARLDASGTRQGLPAPLRSFTSDVDEVEPALIPYGDAIAVLWGRGHHIYICGGCVPDHGVDLLLIDPATLAPVSNIVTLPNGGPTAGGLLRRRTVVLGPSLVFSYLLTFHVHATAGSAAFTCTKP
jgi:hypothetical protein